MNSYIPSTLHIVTEFPPHANEALTENNDNGRITSRHHNRRDTSKYRKLLEKEHFRKYGNLSATWNQRLEREGNCHSGEDQRIHTKGQCLSKFLCYCLCCPTGNITRTFWKDTKMLWSAQREFTWDSRSYRSNQQHCLSWKSKRPKRFLITWRHRLMT